MTTAHVELLLPTYNGARYIREQLDSLQRQTFSDWTLRVRDDGSTDGTTEIVASYAANDSRIRLLPPSANRAGAAQNVSSLLENAAADYVFLCDQDDVWREDKVERSLAHLRRMEERWGRTTPLLVHADLEVVTEQLSSLAPSFWRHRALDAQAGTTFARLLVRNVAVGCTMGLNRALRELVPPIPPDAYMHDWWIALVGAAFGRVERIDAALVKYRQHGENAVGAGRTPSADLLKVLSEPQRLRRYYRKTKAQTEAFLQRFGPRMRESDRRAAELYARGRRGVLRPALLLSAGVRDSNLLRNLSLLAFG